MQKGKNLADLYSHPLISFLNLYNPDVTLLAQGAVALIRNLLPDAIEMLDPSANLVAYGSDRTYNGLICGITLHKEHINIMFADGANLPNPDGLLVGTGKKARHIKISNLQDLNHPAIRTLLQDALKNHGQAL